MSAEDAKIEVPKALRGLGLGRGYLLPLFQFIFIFDLLYSAFCFLRCKILFFFAIFEFLRCMPKYGKVIKSVCSVTLCVVAF